MTVFGDIAGVLAFRTRALRALSGKGSVAAGLFFFSAGFLSFVLIRASVYAEFYEPVPVRPGLVEDLFRLNLVQALLFLSLVWVPAVIVLSNAIATDGLGLMISREQYRAHLAVLCPLWGALFLVAAPLQWLLPRFLVIEVVEIGYGLLVLVLLLLAYTVWAIKQLNYLSRTAALAVFMLSWFTLPVLYVLTAFLFALPFFVLFPLLYLGIQRLRAFEQSRVSQGDFQQHLRALTINPQDADAHYQLGLIHMKRGNLDAAQRYFEAAVGIDAIDPDYHYFLGRVFEAKEDWPKALEQYGETYRLNLQYGLGDVFREVGKGYLHTGSVEKAIEFFRFFLKDRTSDPEGRYWLALALQRAGDAKEMRTQLSTLLDQARTSPRFFRKENRRWIYLARALLRS